MSDRVALLLEIGTEELPPLSLNKLATSLADGVHRALDARALAPSSPHVFATPRRLALRIDELAAREADSRETLKGPPLKVALADDGTPGPAAVAFAKKCGIDVADLERMSDAKGEYFCHHRDVVGQTLAEMLEPILNTVLAELPIVRPMRWGSSDASFVRPVHWVVAMQDALVLPIRLFEQTAGNVTYGHRFHAPDAITLNHARDYEQILANTGYVLADPGARRAQIESLLQATEKELGVRADSDDALLDEVTALVEWPQIVVGEFDAMYLELPREVLTSTLKKHQRYFPLVGADDQLVAKFVTVSNIVSKEPAAVARGNERVIKPRLADAAFFYDADIKTPLAARVADLDRVVYETSLGSLGAKTERVVALSQWLADEVGADKPTAERAARLSRTDLLTDMVGEFPDLQGIMGRYYALAGDEPRAVADAIGDFYRPAFAGDLTPATLAGQVIALADRADTLAGVFAAGKKPKGNKDPFGLRRAALGLARIALENKLDFSLPALLDQAVAGQPEGLATDNLTPVLYSFVLDRLRAHTLASDSAITGEVFDAVAANQPDSLVDFMARLDAVVRFARRDEADALAAANKRIANLLKKSSADGTAAPQESLLAEDAERTLYSATQSVTATIAPLLSQHAYTDALTELAGLREPIDRFFDEVMVMSEDPTLRDNRLALLASIRQGFLGVADISVLSRTR